MKAIARNNAIGGALQPGSAWAGHGYSSKIILISAALTIAAYLGYAYLKYGDLQTYLAWISGKPYLCEGAIDDKANAYTLKITNLRGWSGTLVGLSGDCDLYVKPAIAAELPPHGSIVLYLPSNRSKPIRGLVAQCMILTSQNTLWIDDVAFE
jgi:hypothetical protein